MVGACPLLAKMAAKSLCGPSATDNPKNMRIEINFIESRFAKSGRKVKNITNITDITEIMDIMDIMNWPHSHR